MTTVEPDEQGKTARIEQPAPAPPPSESPAATPAAHPSETVFAEPALAEANPARDAPSAVEPPANVVVPHQEVVFVPLAVNVGDGFKFGCGFFLAFVLMMLIGFVLVAALFVLTSLFGLNLPITR